MTNTKRNTPPKNSNSLKGKKVRDAQRHELFVQWLTGLLHDDHGRAVIRAMVEQHEMPVIDLTQGKSRATKTPACQPAGFKQSN